MPITPGTSEIILAIPSTSTSLGVISRKIEVASLTTPVPPATMPIPIMAPAIGSAYNQPVKCIITPDIITPIEDRASPSRCSHALLIFRSACPLPIISAAATFPIRPMTAIVNINRVSI